jgi:hypothetical protein
MRIGVRVGETWARYFRLALFYPAQVSGSHPDVVKNGAICACPEKKG